MSLRIRITLVVSGFTAVIVLLAGGIIHQLTETDIRHRLDQRLSKQVNVLSDPEILAKTMFLGRFYEVHKEDIGEKLEELLDVQIPTRVLISNKTVIATRGFPEFPLVSFEDGFSEITVDGETWRVRTKTHNRRRLRSSPIFEPVTFQAAMTRGSLNATLKDFRDRFFLIGMLAVMGAGVGGWFLGGAALKPLNRLRQYTESVRDSQDLSQRIPESFGPGEVELLAKTLNEMLIRLQLNSEQTEQSLRASRAFASNVAHELRTPLTSIRMNLDLLERFPGMSSQEKSEVLANVAIEQDQLLTTLESLRLLARSDLSEGEVFEEIDFLQLIQEIIERHKKQWAQGSINLHFPPSPPLILGWREGLTVLFRNVLENAQVHSEIPGDGLVIDFSVRLSGKELIVDIDDNGIGILKIERERIFERFNRGEKSSGTGLGLSLVKQQAELHGGSVDVSDSPAKGARITIILPIIL